ncbi:hypothetical protein ACW9UR_23805 [Halovulum sp. GXIMD14794]
MSTSKKATPAPKSQAKSKQEPRLPYNADRDNVRETITPEIAQELLDTAVGAHEDKRAIETYAQAMSADSWVINGQPLIIDEEGRLIDGVQRLHACIRSGKPFDTFVARSVPADILHTIDQHRRRNYQGVLEARGVEDAGTVVRLMSKLIRIENGVLGRDSQVSISWSRFDQVLAANPELHDAVKIANRFSSASLHSTSRPTLCFMAILAGKRDELESFLQQLTFNHTEGLESPARMFGIQLGMWHNAAKEARRMGRTNNQPVDTILAHAILHFNAYCRGEKLSAPLTWSPDYGTREVVRTVNGKEKAEKVPATESDFNKKTAPPNLGMPMMDGYPGLREGRFDPSSNTDELAGELAEIVHTGAERKADEVYVTRITVTPDMASKWLSPKINRKNRRTQKNHVAAIARDIRNGNWMMNAQPICFTKDPLKEYPAGEEPRLLNGQHRLLGIRDADMPVELPIAVNIPEEAFATFDTHAKRTVRKAGPKTDDRVLVAAARFQYKEDNQIPLSSSDTLTLTSSELLKVIEKHPGMADNFALARKAGMKQLGSAGVMTYFLYRVKREHPELAEEFLSKIETGLNITDPQDPATKLRRELAKTTPGSRGRTRKEQIEALISHWNAYVRWATSK